jgi:hypothetical protein
LHGLRHGVAQAGLVQLRNLGATALTKRLAH